MNMDTKVVWKNNKPYGIRNANGYLLFFPQIRKFDGQDERYRTEIKEQESLAYYLVECIKKEEFSNA